MKNKNLMLTSAFLKINVYLSIFFLNFSTSLSICCAIVVWLSVEEKYFLQKKRKINIISIYHKKKIV